jgi:hypothetical protein
MSLFFLFSFFYKTENRKARQVLSGGRYQWQKGGYKKRMKEGEYGANTVYTCMKMEK